VISWFSNFVFFKCNLYRYVAVASYGKVCDRDGISDVFRALTAAEYYLVVGLVHKLNAVDPHSARKRRPVSTLGAG
jgi:hypothetical protein